MLGGKRVSILLNLFQFIAQPLAAASAAAESRSAKAATEMNRNVVKVPERRADMSFPFGKVANTLAPGAAMLK